MGFDNTDYQNLVDVKWNVRDIVDRVKNIERAVEYLTHRESPKQTFEEYYSTGASAREYEHWRQQKKVIKIKEKEDNARRVEKEKKHKEHIESIERDYDEVWTSHFRPYKIWLEMAILFIAVALWLAYQTSLGDAAVLKVPWEGMFFFVVFGYPGCYAALHCIALYNLYINYPADYKKAQPYADYLIHGDKD